MNVQAEACVRERGNLTYTGAALKRRKCRPKRDISLFEIRA